MRIGITGSTGFIGHHLIRHLLKKEVYKIKALSRSAQKISSGGVIAQWQIGDLLSLSSCEQFVSDLDVIIYLAHQNSPINSNDDIVSDNQMNFTAFLNLLEAIKRDKTTRKTDQKKLLIYASSGGSVYGKNQARLPSKESDLCLPQSSYGIVKLAAEHYLRLWSEIGFLRGVVLRIANPFGAGLNPNRQQGLIGVILSQLKERGKITLFGSPENVRDFIHIDDVSSAFELALGYKGQFDIFNIGTMKGSSVNQILQLLEQIHGAPFEREIIDLPLTSVFSDYAVLDNSKAKAVFGWSPKIDLEIGIHRLYEEIFEPKN